MSVLIPALLLLWPQSGPPEVQQQLKTFIDVYAAVEREAADPIGPEKALYEGAIPGMLRRLDPHSVFFDPAQFQQLKELETSTRKGFGSIVSVAPGRVIVLQVLPGTPAGRSGLGPGDEILAVNNIAIARLDVDQIVGLLSQTRQNQARIDVRRPGNARILAFNLTPEELQTPSVERAFLLRPGIGYLRVASFDADTGGQIRQAIEKLGGAGLAGLVLDLRNNPGGVLTSALETAALFLKPGQRLVTVRGRAMASQQQSVPDDAKPYGFPLAVLVNGRSASASEIVAGSLQDHDRAIIVGEPSFGKGLVQSVYPLGEGTGLALTTAYYYTPSGRSIQKPLEGAQIATDIAGRSRDYQTDAGRHVHGGGGIQPDYVVYPESMSRFRTALEASGAFTSFATEYTRAHRDVEDTFEVGPALLDQFQIWLSEHGIRPSVTEWSGEREWLRNRLKTEIFNQALGVARGDEVEAQRDPVIETALAHLSAGAIARSN